MQISPLTIYAVQTLRAIDAGGRLSIDEIARQLDISFAYARKVTWCLKNGGLLKPSRGAQGGYELAKPLHQIPARQVLEATEGILNPQQRDTSDMATIRQGLHKRICAGLEAGVSRL
jgi:Rrf2 family protein